MLVLKRKVGESFTIDGNIKVKVINNFGSVRIGIEAPRHIRIVRDELKNTNQIKDQIK